MPKSFLSEASVRGKKKKKENQRLVFVFKKQKKVLLEIVLQVHSYKWRKYLWRMMLCTSNRSVLWADYNGMPRTGTYLSSPTSVCSALEYSNDCLWTLKSQMELYSTSSPRHHLNMLCEEGGFLKRVWIRWILGKKRSWNPELLKIFLSGW